MSEIRVILVDEHDKEIGTEEKLQAHKDGLLHRAFSIFVFNSKGEMLIQKRAEGKYHSGGLWSNTCCSHPRPDEKLNEAIHRRLQEEMGFDCELTEKFTFIYKVNFGKVNGMDMNEHEYLHVYSGVSDAIPVVNPEEASEYKWISRQDLLDDLRDNPGNYTYWFKIAVPKLYEQEGILVDIKAGKVFIYPTDTIYGLGCDATNAEAVKRIREIKKREEKPFLIIAPTFEWILENCFVNPEQEKIMRDKLPGPYSFFLKFKNKNVLAYKDIVPIDDGTIGVRLINHPFQKIVEQFGKPFVTTSVNITGQERATSLENIPEEIKQKVDRIIYEGVKDGAPSTRINLV